MARRLFGTDGVRGVAGELLTADLAMKLGRAATLQSGATDAAGARDPRHARERRDARGGAGGGGRRRGRRGLPRRRPADARPRRCCWAATASTSRPSSRASHNPYRDNGIKFFGADGFKLSDATEEAIEALLDEPSTAAAIGRIRALHGTEEDYLRELHTRFADLDLAGVDGAARLRQRRHLRGGAGDLPAPGRDVTVVADTPDGRNINEGCGSTHVEALAAQVADGGHDVGFAFDGDGDRVLAVDRDGVVVDGDELIALAALHLREAGRLPGDGVAVTVMTNYGFHAAMKEHGIEVATTQVGDRYVLEELRARGWVLGGEQSGHIIDTNFVASGDGIASALLALEALRGGDLAERDAMRKLPQRLVNVKVADRDAAMGSDELAQAVAEAADALEGRGRVLVRPSGTEQLVRVMVEAPDADEADAVCARLVAVVERTASAA